MRPRYIPLAILAPLAIPAQATDFLHHPVLETDLFISGGLYDDVDNTMLGGGLGITGHIGPFYVHGSAEGLDESDGTAEALKGKFAVGALGRWDAQQTVILELGGRYLDSSWQGDWEGERTDIAVELGFRGQSHHIQTDLRAVMLYPTDDDANVQAGGRIDILTLNEDGRYGFLISGEYLTDEQNVRVGLRRRF
ncbi:hypothetical protein HH1059_05550 [Halorhodospira halochloris]|uniref:Outer membrane protein beta-barrel domain-containing protein n=1 Tax=Halorhodospira halochloris TaxID=1052 RepID=A0A0X8X7Z5_HALHR|nr:hypothetical protein [Halorhodospira halochloris]MBK1651497.1 hypothetical protein [Halorhodospira halochloris]BAU57239.1 hypothetical protein HH1059_05550 [Halorhodospira halochloris]